MTNLDKASFMSPHINNNFKMIYFDYIFIFSARNEFNFQEIFSVKTTPRHCILVEGSPGYGKTTLARNIAVDWSQKADYVNEFKLVIFIYCRDLKGNTIENYVAETYPATELGNQKINLKDWVEHRKNILFILDGLDECSPVDATEINKLLEGNKYPAASILATTRPLTEDTSINRGQFTKSVSIKGFNKDQIERIIDNHFKHRQGMGERMKRELFSGLQVYQDLATCPLLCQLFCLLFDKDEKFPDKVTDVYYGLIVFLVR